jgi:L-lactate dehydrogenase complex protein LldF
MTGANLRHRETGSIVVCTNEGNADLERAPAEALHRLGRHRESDSRVEHLGVFVRMLSRSALGSPITQLTSHFPRAARGHGDARRPASTMAAPSAWAWGILGTR